MKTYFFNIWDTIRTSYWFIPSLFAIGTLFLFWATLELQPIVVDHWTFVPGWFETKAGTARAILSAVAGAMVAVTGTVFSITIVILSLASQQFGPRLLRTFMHDLPTQMTLGIFLATGFYSLLALGLVETPAIPISEFHVSVFFTFVLTVISMLTLVFFIHNVAVLIQAPHVVAGVAKDLDESIERLFPHLLAEKGGVRAEIISDDLPDPCEDGRIVVRSTREGYVQAIDDDALLDLACNENFILRFLCRPGDFIACDEPILELWPADGSIGDPAEKKLKKWCDEVNDAVIVGIRRTPRQDVECALEELVEVAVRALSPGVNDPFTAINCIDRLGASLSRLVRRKFPEPLRYDNDSQLRMILRHVTFPGILDNAFHQIRQHGKDSVAVTIHLLEALIVVAGEATREADLDAIRRHAEMVARNARRWQEPNDVADVSRRLEQLIYDIGVRTQQVKTPNPNPEFLL